MTTWRAFVGDWGDDHRARWVDEADLTWDQARAKVRAHAAAFEPPPDGCTSCWETANEVIADLDALTDGTEWTGELEGEDLLLIRGDGTSQAAADLEARQASGWRQLDPIPPDADRRTILASFGETAGITLRNGETVTVQWSTGGIMAP